MYYAKIPYMQYAICHMRLWQNMEMHVNICGASTAANMSTNANANANRSRFQLVQLPIGVKMNANAI